MVDTGFPWILLAAALYGIVHSILASQRVKTQAARWFGQAAYQRFYRLFFVVAAVITALPLVALVGLLPDRHIYSIPAPWVYLTLVVQAAALFMLLFSVMQTGVMRFLGLNQLSRSFSQQNNSAPEKLILNGFYHWMRHPIYTASFVLLWLVPVMTWNVLAFNLGLSVYMLTGSVFEEQKLIQQFGKEYEAYRKRTPRFIPGLKRRP
jgi:protein-S-isoprenylcysteine O-methyltransferase Ste14